MIPLLRLRTPAADEPGPEDSLPHNVEDVRQNFITTVQAMAVVTTLFAGIQAQLLSGVPAEPSPTASRAIIRALLLASYAGLSVNVGAALSGMIFLDIAGEAPEAFRRLVQTAPRPSAQAITTSTTGLELLVLHGSPRSLQLAWYHCISSTIFGTFSILVQISLLAWINIASQMQMSGIFVGVVLALFWAALPLPGFLIYNFGVGFVAGLKGKPEY